jgi:hypothetical protein
MDQAEIIARAVYSSKTFVNEIFSKSFENFISGSYVNKTAIFLRKYDRTCRVSARDHFKSAGFYCHFMEELLRYADCDYDREYHYFSFGDDMAAYHIGKIKNLIKNNPFYESLIDVKSTAEGVILYKWKGKRSTFSLEPHGMTSFKRGLHCNGGIYVDDPFQDPANKLDPKVIYRVNDIMKTQIMAIPTAGAFLHIAGTAQTKDDFFFDTKFLGRFETRIIPAEVDSQNKIALWPEHMNWDELKAREKELGEKIYRQEYLCSPIYSESSFFNDEQMKSMCFDIPNLSWNKEHDFGDDDIIAGWDLGKHRHPAHFSIFRIHGDPEDGMWEQVHQVFFDGWEYDKQLDYIKACIENFNIDKLFYDNTRGEMEVVAEKNELPNEMIGVVFTLKKKNAMAVEFDKRRTNGKIKLINDERQKRSMLCVQNDLTAIETQDGHGDAFWSTSLCFNYLIEPKIGIY